VSLWTKEGVKLTLVGDREDWVWYAYSMQHAHMYHETHSMQHAHMYHASFAGGRNAISCQLRWWAQRENLMQ
jgi:hypothetical protein